MRRARLLLAVSLFSFVGCGQPGASTPTAATSDATPAVAASGEGAAIPEGLAELSPEDRALVLKQKICPVSEHALGEMGKPAKFEINGKTVFVCCPPCEDPIRANPEKYLAKVFGETPDLAPPAAATSTEPQAEKPAEPAKPAESAPASEPVKPGDAETPAEATPAPASE